MGSEKIDLRQKSEASCERRNGDGAQTTMIYGWIWNRWDRDVSVCNGDIQIKAVQRHCCVA